jgi:colicin import membrane protein
VTGGPENAAELAAELERLRKLEQGLRAEHERIRAAAAEQVVRLQTALRETAARAAQRDREVQRLQAELQEAAGDRARPRRGSRYLGRPQPGGGEQDATAVLERMRAAFERERKKLEERARAVAETEARQRAAEAALLAARERLSEVEGGADVGSPLPAADASWGGPEQREREERERMAAVVARREQLLSRELELARREEEAKQREIQLSLVHRRIGEEERRLQERAWRTGAQELRARRPLLDRRPEGVTFSEGWRRLAGGRGGDRGDGGGGSW